MLRCSSCRYDTALALSLISESKMRALPLRSGRLRTALFSILSLLVACARRPSVCPDCGTVVIAATGEPASLVPPLVSETVGRDISDQIYERLAYLSPGASPIDQNGYQPGLAERWERIDSLAWRFHLRPKGRWQDGRPITAEDVVFSFEAFSDSTLGAAAQGYLAGKVRARAEDSLTVRVAFAERSPEQLYDATYHVRVVPRHVWDTIPPARWAADTTLSHLIGSGPYRIQSWQRGRSLSLAADTAWTGGTPPSIRRVVWRFASDPDAALNLLLSHEADFMETVGSKQRVDRVAHDTMFTLMSYPAGVYGFLAFRVADAMGRAHPVLADRELRRALVEAVGRPPPGPGGFWGATRGPPGPVLRPRWGWGGKNATPPYAPTA